MPAVGLLLPAALFAGCFALGRVKAGFASQRAAVDNKDDDGDDDDIRALSSNNPVRTTSNIHALQMPQMVAMARVEGKGTAATELAGADRNC